ncbi:MAG: ester cyclase [Candidatus Heimdallarchaeota archaeon]|nr:ester cyclase [Candidatus Heimdallarchaeota archaeon]
MDKDSIQVVKDYIEAWNNNDSERMKSLVHPNYSVGKRTRDSYTIIEDEVPYFEANNTEKNEIDLLLLRMKKYHKGLSEFNMALIDINSLGTHVWADMDLTGIHSGPLFGISPSNNPLLIRGMFHYQIKDGLLYKADWLYDTVSLLKQFGKSIKGANITEAAQYLSLLSKMGLIDSSDKI